MVTVPNSLSMNAVKFQKAKSAPLAIKKNISQKPVQVNKKTIDEGTMRKMLTEAEQSGVDKTEIIQGLLDRGYDIEEPKTFMQKVGQVGKDIAGGTLAGFSKLPTNIVGGAIKGLGSIPIAPGMDLPKTPLQTKLQTVGSDIIKSGEQTAAQNIAITGARPGAIGTQAGEMVAPLATAIVGGAATGLTKAGAGALGTVGRGIAQRSTPTIAKGLAQGALVGAGEQAIYDVAAQGKTTPESLAFGATAGGVVTGLPLVKKAGEVVGKPVLKGVKGLGKSIATKFGKKSEEFATKGLMNVADARNTLRNLGETAGDDAGALGRWLINNKVIGGNEQSVIKKAGAIGEKQYNNVRKIISWMDQNAGKIGADENVSKAMTMVGKQIDSINARAGVDIMDKTEVEDILKASIDGNLTYTQKQRAKELMDEFINIYKKSGETSDTLLAKGAEPIRKAIRSSLEDAVTKITNGKVNLKGINRDVAVAKAVQRGVETKQVANQLKQFVVQGGVGSFTATAGQPLDPTNPEWLARFVVGAFLGRQAGKLLGSPAFNAQVAKVLNKLSFGTRNALIEYAKAPTVKKLTQMQLDEILSVKQSLSPLAQNVDSMTTTPMSPSIPSVVSDIDSTMTKGIKETTAQSTKTAPKLPVTKKTPLKQATATKKVSPKAPKALKTPTPMSKVDDMENIGVVEDIAKKAKNYEEFAKTIDSDNSLFYRVAKKYGKDVNKGYKEIWDNFGGKVEDALPGKTKMDSIDEAMVKMETPEWRMKYLKEQIPIEEKKYIDFTEGKGGVPLVNGKPLSGSIEKQRKRVFDMRKELADLEGQADTALPWKEKMKQSAKSLDKIDDGLIAEARKYDSADEWIEKGNRQKELLYRKIDDVTKSYSTEGLSDVKYNGTLYKGESEKDILRNVISNADVYIEGKVKLADTGRLFVDDADISDVFYLRASGGGSIRREVSGEFAKKVLEGKQKVKEIREGITKDGLRKIREEAQKTK